MSHENLDRQLDRLFASYRDACPDLEASPNFMPSLWMKIEARQSPWFQVPRLARVFVSGAAVMCLLMGALLFMPSASNGRLTYLEILERDMPTETLAYADIEDMPAEMEWQ